MYFVQIITYGFLSYIFLYFVQRITFFCTYCFFFPAVLRKWYKRILTLTIRVQSLTQLMLSSKWCTYTAPWGIFYLLLDLYLHIVAYNWILNCLVLVFHHLILSPQKQKIITTIDFHNKNVSLHYFYYDKQMLPFFLFFFSIFVFCIPYCFPKRKKTTDNWFP